MSIAGDRARRRVAWRVRLALVAALASLLEHPAAHAQGARDPIGAEALFRQGRAAADEGDFQTACAKFAESQRLDPSAGTLFNLAHCEERIGRIASAWQHYRQVLGQLKPDDKRSAFAQERVTDLEPRLPKLLVRLPDPVPPGLRVLRDDTELGAATLGVPLPIDPGAHRVRISATGRGENIIEVKLVESRTEEVVAEPGPPLSEVAALPPPPPTTPLRREAPPPPPAPGWRTAGWVLTGAGGTGLVLGTIAGAMVLREKGIQDEYCDRNEQDSGWDCFDQRGVEASERGPRWATVSNIAFPIGAVALAAGVVILLTLPSETAVNVALRPDGAAFAF